jgi:CheY-like chemotaxis protein
VRGAHRLVLIVDDTADTREMYSQYLTSRGFTVLTARDGAFGVDMALRRRPDVIVMDLAMPNVDGITATQRLKREIETRRTPILILTGYPMQAIERGALEAGADVFLTKPCLPEDLEQHVQRLLDRAA